MKTFEQVQKETKEWNNRLKNCQCHTPFNTLWGSNYKIKQIYKYTCSKIRANHSLVIKRNRHMLF